jgi:outer membrane protein assembly factor BamB
MLLALVLSAGPPAWPGFGGPAADFAAPALPPGPPAVRWRRPLGPGESGVVTDGTAVFTLYSVATDKKTGEEVVLAADAATGDTRWEHRYPLAMRPNQQTFRGDPIGPQATPLVHAGRLVTVGFAGALHALDPATGAVAWRHDLVADFGATPVQFGFSGSPVGLGDRILVPVGGNRAAVVALSAADGAVRWASEPAEPSYATPVVMSVAGEQQVVQVTRDHVLGLSAADGTTRWKYPFKDKGLTNVPTPLPLPGDRLLISGQGADGTRLLQLTRTSAAEVWARKQPRFFHFNWLTADRLVFGYADKSLVAVRLADGETAWTKGGLAGGNLARVGDAFLRLRETGDLARLRLTADGAGEPEPLATAAGRCWTPPAVSGTTVFVRSNRELLAVGW